MEHFELDSPLFEFTVQGLTNHFTLRHSVEGVLITGGIGSGKTSGSGRMIALKYLAAGFGGLVLCAKPEEKQIWQEYCRLTGREKDLIILEPHGSHSFNFLEYESSPPSGISSTDTLVQVLKTVIRAGQEQDAGRTDDSFWETALDMLICNIIDICKLAYGKVSIQTMYDIVQSIPKSRDELYSETEDGESKAFQKAFEAARKFVTAQIDLWVEQLPETERKRLEDDAVFQAELLDALPDARLLKMIDGFFIDNFVGLSDKTRSIIDFSFSGFLFRLLREPIYSLFCKNPSSFTPEDSLNGRIIILNIPVKTYEKPARDAQILF